MAKSNRPSAHGEGYVMLYRKSLTSAVFQDEKTWKVWSWCVLRANWQTIPIDYCGEEIVLRPGQFYTGTFSMVGELKMSRSTAWRHLKKLQNWGNIGIETVRHGSVITVTNYSLYQDPTRSEFVDDGNEMGNQWETSGKPVGNQREQIRSKEVKKQRIPLSLEEAVQLFVERGYVNATTEAEAFWNHYQANGWVIGRGRAPCRDWKAAAANWNKNAKEWAGGTHNGRINRKDARERETFSSDTVERVIALNPKPAGERGKVEGDH
jgi:hypothetical protein